MFLIIYKNKRSCFSKVFANYFSSSLPKYCTRLVLCGIIKQVIDKIHHKFFRRRTNEGNSKRC